MISQTAEYALQAIVLLASTRPAEPVRVGELAEALGAPRNYLSKILGTLARGGLLTSLRGPAGGFVLAVPPERLELSRIVGLFDSPPGQRCLMGRRQCDGANPCAAHGLWKGVAEQVDGFFRETTVAQLLGGAVAEVDSARWKTGTGGRSRAGHAGRGPGRKGRKEVERG